MNKCPKCDKLRILDGWSEEQTQVFLQWMLKEIESRGKTNFWSFLSGTFCGCRVSLLEVESLVRKASRARGRREVWEALRVITLLMAVVTGVGLCIAIIALPLFVAFTDNLPFWAVVVANYCLAMIWALLCFALWAVAHDRGREQRSDKPVPGMEWRFVLPGGKLGGRAGDVTWSELERNNPPTSYLGVFIFWFLVHAVLASLSTFVNGRMYLKIWNSWIWW